MPEPAGLYVHVPFCARRCRYCGFVSEVRPVPAGFGAALLAEVAARLREPGLPEPVPVPERFDTLYVGGGTPSVVEAARLARWITDLRARVRLPDHAEVTVEVNPDDVDDGLLDALAGAGVNRISLGVQSFADPGLRWMGRRHTADQARAALRRITARAEFRVSLDLIYGWPGQRAADWEADLREAVGWGVGHLSAYALTVEPGTPLGRDVASGRVRVADDELLADRFLQTGAVLASAGWHRYEVSNYARSPGERARHNQKYWHHVPYLGVGPAAHSLLGRYRWWNVSDVETYLARSRRGESVRDGVERLDGEQFGLEALMLGFRTTRGVPEALLTSVPENRQILEALVGEGLVARAGGWVRPTPRGMLVADGLALRFRPPARVRLPGIGDGRK